ncbi:MAG TPA: metallophosphoesterase [Opitutaceae bacterium]|nr:metallophosphoesterase [Opitutaceae bacterium]
MAASKAARIEIEPGVWLDTRRALFIEPLGALVIADIHWGFAASHRLEGNLLPMWGDDQIAQTLLQLIKDYHPAEMIWLGDSLHRVTGCRIAEIFLREISVLPVAVSIVIGNHDRKWSIPATTSLQRGKYFFHHGDRGLQEKPAGAVEVIGHFHPAVSLYDGAGARVRLPALVQSPERLILPAFSPWAAGAAWNENRAPGEKIWAVAPSRVFAVRFPQSPARTVTS